MARNKFPFYLKRVALYLLAIIIVSLIAATLMPQEKAEIYFYRSWWFCLLWGMVGIVLLLGLIFRLLSGKKVPDVFFIHLGLLIVIIGAFLSSLLRVEGFIEISEGESRNRIYIEDDIIQPLNFLVRLDKFSVEYYPPRPSGMRLVKDYKADISILSGGELVRRGTIEVNHPLKFGGFNLYQYGHEPEKPDTTLLQVVKDPSLPVIYSGYLVVLAGMTTLLRKAFPEGGNTF